MADAAAAQELDAAALAEVLTRAKLSVDQAVGQLRTAGALSDDLSRQLRADGPSNSSCNTGCTCRAVEEVSE